MDHSKDLLDQEKTTMNIFHGTVEYSVHGLLDTGFESSPRSPYVVFADVVVVTAVVIVPKTSWSTKTFATFAKHMGWYR